MKDPAPRIESLSAVTLATADMGRSLAFYASLGFSLTRGGADAPNRWTRLPAYPLRPNLDRRNVPST